MNKKIKEKIYSIAAITIMLDQIIKLIIVRKIENNTVINVIPNFFQISHVENKGAAFSILNNHQILLIALSLVAIFLLNKYLDYETRINKYKLLSYGLVIGGIVGNLLDRLINNAVIDYLSFKLFNYYFPVFNLADTCIVIGIIILIISILKEENESKKTPVKERLKEQVEVIKNEKKTNTNKSVKKVNTNSKKKKTNKKKK